MKKFCPIWINCSYRLEKMKKENKKKENKKSK